MATRLRPYRIDRGIGQYEVDDYYAVLGVPVSSNPILIRNRYLSLAKQLHPDITQTHKANEYLAKLVNPAYEVLQQERERSEYLDLLRLLAKRLLKQSLKDFTPRSEPAQKLMACPSVTVYERMVAEIARAQFQNLDKSMEYIGWLSELNLIYLLLKEGYKPEGTGNEVIKTVKYEDFKTVKDPNNPQNVKRHLVKAQEHIKAQLWTMALQELRTALQLDPKNSLCHALLGKVYVHQNVLGMAKASFQQALKYNPQEPIALEGMKELGKLEKQRSSVKQKSEQNGFFGWLGNKK